MIKVRITIYLKYNPTVLVETVEVESEDLALQIQKAVDTDLKEIFDTGIKGVLRFGQLNICSDQIAAYRFEIIH